MGRKLFLPQMNAVKKQISTLPLFYLQERIGMSKECHCYRKPGRTLLEWKPARRPVGITQSG